MQTHKYDIFVSYDHSADAAIAGALQSALQTLAKPWYRRYALKVFRDKTDLTASADLWQSICNAMDDATMFLLVASPHSACSPNVAREVAYWLRTRGPANIAIALSGGRISWSTATPPQDDFDWEVTTSLPACLKGVFAAEPLWVTVADSATPFTRRDGRTLEAAARIGAAARGWELRTFIGTDEREHRRTLRTAKLGATVLVALAATAAVFAVRAGDERTRAVWKSYVGNIRAAQAAVDAANGSSLQLFLEDCAPSLRGWEWAYLHAVSDEATLASAPTGYTVDAIVYNAVGTRLATLSRGSKRIDIRDARTLASEVAIIDSLLAPGPNAFQEYPTLGFCCRDSVLVASAGGVIRFWDATTGALRRSIDVQSGFVTGIAVAAAAPRFASTEAACTVHVWDTHSAKALRTIVLRAQPCAIQLDSTGALVGVASYAAEDPPKVWRQEYHDVRVWDVASGAVVESCRVKMRHGYVASGRFSDDLRQFVWTSSDTLRVYDTSSGTLLSAGRKQVPDTWAAHPVFSDGKALVLTADSRIQVWRRTPYMEVAATLLGPRTAITAIAMKSHASCFATGSADGVVTLWDTRPRRCHLELDQAWTNDVLVAPSGTAAAAIVNDAIRVWRLPELSEVNISEAFRSSATLLCGAGNGFIVATRGTTLAKCTWDGEYTILCTVPDTLTAIVANPYTGAIMAATYRRQPRRVAVLAVDEGTGAVTTLADGGRKRVHALAVAEHGQLVLVGSDSVAVMRTDGRVLTRHGGPTKWVRDIEVSSRGTFVAWSQGRVSVYDNIRKVGRDFIEAGDGITDLQWMGAERRLATASSTGGGLKVWDGTTGDLLLGLGGSWFSTTWNPTRRGLVAVGYGKLEFWEAQYLENGFAEDTGPTAP